MAEKAGVALGLATYHFTDKITLVAAALERLGTQDALMLESKPAADPVTQLRRALRRVADQEFLATDYLALRLQLWALAPVDPTYAPINHETQRRYGERLAELISRGWPGLTPAVAAHAGRRRPDRPERHLAHLAAQHRPRRDRPGPSAAASRSRSTWPTEDSIVGP